MNVRLAEACRDNPLEISLKEQRVQQVIDSSAPSVSSCAPAPCTQEIFLGFYFDGTNNNKYRDTPDQSQSNVARLFEACPGTPSSIAATYGGQQDRVFQGGVPAAELKYYRKTYIPGLGTAFPEIKDTGEGWWDRKGGLAAAMQGEARIVWALLQITEHLHQILVGSRFPGAEKDGELARVSFESSEVMLKNALDAALRAHPLTRGDANRRMAVRRERLQVLRERAARLATLAADRLKAKPTITRIRISAFGFSRGAAEARVFANWLLEAYGGGLAGIPVQIDFLGVFDTVASVGAAHGTLVADGHMGWADGENMVIPTEVRRCVHLVSAHEVRGSFPLDSVCQGTALPPNCKEVVYPGVHSDVGGGYPPHDQGRAPSDADKLSQIPLAQMYREAVIAGVPLARPAQMGPFTQPMFQISPALKQAFNAYIAATRKGSVAPAGLKDPLFPEETQPPGSVSEILRQQYAHYLAWRKFRLGNIHLLPHLQAAPPASRIQDAHLQAVRTASRIQDIEDIRQADVDLTEELALLQQPMIVRALKLSLPDRALQALAHAAQAEKFADWQEIEPIWRRADLKLPADKAVIELFDRYVHDSRAWFKVLAKDDAEWFPSKQADGRTSPGQLDALKAQKLAQLQGERALCLSQQAALQGDIDGMRKAGRTHTPLFTQRERLLQQSRVELGRIDAEIAAFSEGRKTFLNRGLMNQEVYSVWGYLRWRRIYTTGTLRVARTVYRPIDRAERLRELDQRHAQYMTHLLKNLEDGRQRIRAEQGDLKRYEETSQYLIKYTTDWMTKERAAL